MRRQVVMKEFFLVFTFVIILCAMTLASCSPPPTQAQTTGAGVLAAVWSFIL